MATVSVRYIVDDVDAAIDFYCQRLGAAPARGSFSQRHRHRGGWQANTRGGPLWQPDRVVRADARRGEALKRYRINERAQAPLQGDESAPDAWLVFNAAVTQGLDDLEVGAELLVLTWLHEARRDVLSVHPRGDPTIPMHGVFSTRSPDRPNPIGLHRVQILAIDGRGSRSGTSRRSTALRSST